MLGQRLLRQASSNYPDDYRDKDGSDDIKCQYEDDLYWVSKD